MTQKVKIVSTWVSCSGCCKKYRVSKSVLGRWARCKNCGAKFLHVDSSRARKAPTGDLKQKKTREDEESFQHPSAQQESRIASSFQRPFNVASSQSNQLLPCPVCQEAYLAGLSLCPTCGQSLQKVILSFKGERALRLETELIATAKISLLIGSVAVILSLAALIPADSFLQTILCLAVAFSGGGSALGGYQLHTFRCLGRYITGFGLALLAGFSVITTWCYATTAVFLLTLFISVYLLMLVVISLHPEAGRVCSATYQMAIRPKLRHDRPIPILMGAFLGYVFFMGVLYLWIR